MSKRGVRFIPRVKDPREQLVKLSLARGWHLKKAIVADPETRTPGEFIYLVRDSETWVILRDDLLTGIHFVHIVGPDQERLATEVEPDFDPWPEEVLLAWWDRGVKDNDVDDRVDAVLFLGVNSPEQPREEYVTRIRAGMSDSDEDVRNAAVAATAFADWRVFRPDLERVAAIDPGEQARRQAQFILDGWSREDAGGAFQ